MAMNEMICKENKMKCLPFSDFQKFIINGDGGMESDTFTTLPVATKRTDRYGTQITCGKEV